MIQPGILDYLIGPAGVTVLVLLAIVALVRGQFVAPKYVLESSETRNRILEGENKEQHDTIIELTRLNGMLGAQVEALREDVRELRVSNERLEREVADLRGQLTGGG